MINMSDEETEGPPTGVRKYPETPMPQHEEPERDSPQPNVFNNSILFLFVALALGQFWTVMALQTDINIVLAYQQEHVGQFKHMVNLLENMQQVKWQMVPST